MRLPPAVLLLIVVLSNLLNYIDRGIVPGAANEIQDFISESLGRGVGAQTVSAWFGALVSAYIASYSISAVIFGQLARSEKKPLRLVGVGLIVWCMAAILCFFAQPPPGEKATLFRFALLLAGRAISGVGEAGFQCIVPGLIMATAPPHRKALWMAALYTPIPVGMAMGYMLGAILASSSCGWGGAYGAEAILMMPLAVLFCVDDRPRADDSEEAKREEDHDLLGGKPLSDRSDQLLGNGSSLGSSDRQVDTSFWAGVGAVLSSVEFCRITMGYAAHTAVFAGLAAFGPTLVLGLGFFRGKETLASTAFGAAVALGGAIGTPLGGWLSDKSAGTPSVAEEELSTTDRRMDTELKRAEERQRCLRTMIGMIGIAAVIAMCCTAAPSESVFLPLIMIVVMFAYGAQASITMAILSCVTSDLQPLAMSLTTLGIHAFGDVPSPIIIGLLKGSLAPHCVVLPHSSSTGSRVLTLDPRCAHDRAGLRLTLAITVGYLFTTVLWWISAYVACQRAKQKAESAQEQYKGIA